MTTDAIGVRVVDQARRDLDLDALPLPACNRTRVYPSSVTISGRSRINPTSAERVGVRGTRIRCARSAPHPISLVVAASGPLPACGVWAPQAPAPCAGKPDEGACAAYFPLTRVTRIFQKSVLTKIASAGRGGTWLPAPLLPARGRRRAGVPNATFRCRQWSPAQLRCFRIVINNGWHNSRACRRPSRPGAQR